MYPQPIESSSPSYDFRKDFDPIARPGMNRYQRACGCDPDEPGEMHDECWEAGNDYVRQLWRALNRIQRDYQELGHLDDLELYGIADWTRESVAAYVEARLVGILADFEPTPPVDVERTVRLGTELARKQNADGELPFQIDLSSEAIAFATDHLKSKIERDLVCNPISTFHTGLLNYRFFKEMNGGNVVYLDRHISPGRAPEQAAPKPDAKPSVECMFQRVGFLDAKPREFIVSGLIPKNEVCSPFGRPDLFKGVSATQLVVHISGGVDFLGMPVKQAPTAYFAGERAGQVKRRIKGHIQRLGLPHDLPCYFGDRPIDLLSKADLELVITNIKAIESDAGQPLGFLVIDTQSRTFGGDENSTKDGAAYAKAIEAIRQATEATLWIIAHTGHDGEKQGRPRGSSTLMGAYDTFYHHKKINQHSGEIKITIDRDGLGGKVIPFAVELYDTGAVNEDGEPVIVPYLEAAKPLVKLTFRKGEQIMSAEKTTKTEKLALRALAKAVNQNGVSEGALSTPMSQTGLQSLEMRSKAKATLSARRSSEPLGA